MEKSPKPIESKIPEYGFNEGVTEAVCRIKALLKDLDRDVFVSIHGSGPDVGKTWLVGALRNKLYIPLLNQGILLGYSVVNSGETKRRVLILEDYPFPEKLKNVNFRPGKLCDLSIYIYRPDIGKPSSEYLKLIDLLICNEFAKDDPRKIGYQKRI